MTLYVLKKIYFVVQDVPNPVALEPCAGNRAAVLTLLVRQPTGNDRFTPHGYSGMPNILNAYYLFRYQSG